MESIHRDAAQPQPCAPPAAVTASPTPSLPGLPAATAVGRTFTSWPFPASSISQQHAVPRSVLQPPLCAFPTTVGETSHNTHKPARDSLANSASATPTVLQEVSGGEGAKFEPASNSLSSYRSVISHHGGGTSPCSAPRAQPSPAHHRLSASNAAALHHF